MKHGISPDASLGERVGPDALKSCRGAARVHFVCTNFAHVRKSGRLDDNNHL